MVFIFVSTRLIRWAIRGSSGRNCRTTARQQRPGQPPTAGPVAAPARPPLPVAESEAMCRQGFLVTSIVSFALFLLLTVSIVLNIVHVHKTVKDDPIEMTCQVTSGIARACVVCDDAALNVAARDCKPLFEMAWLQSFGKALWLVMAISWLIEIIASLLLGGVAVFLWYTVLPLDAERVLQIAGLELVLQILIDFTGVAMVIAGYMISSAVHGEFGVPFGAGGWLFTAAGGLSLAKYWTYAKLRAGSMELKRSHQAEANGELDHTSEQPLMDRSTTNGTVDAQPTTSSAAPQQQQQYQQPVYAQPYIVPMQQSAAHHHHHHPAYAAPLSHKVVRAVPIYPSAYPVGDAHGGGGGGGAVYRDADDV